MRFSTYGHSWIYIISKLAFHQYKEEQCVGVYLSLNISITDGWTDKSFFSLNLTQKTGVA